MTDIAVSVRITGRVHGVAFRAWTRDMARDLGLSGWVRNCQDGSVEALFAGPEEAVASMLLACRRGPTYARVDDVRTSPAETPDKAGFEIRR